MLDIKWIRDNPEALDAALKDRGAAPLSAEILRLDEARRDHLRRLQELQGRRNEVSKEIGKAKGAGDSARAEALMREVAEIKGAVQEGEETERRLDANLQDVLSQIPNIPLDDVPVGAPGAFVIEPDGAIIRAGLVRHWGARYGLMQRQTPQEPSPWPQSVWV